MIRKYKESDLEPLLAVWTAATAVAHPFLTAEFLAAERENISKIYLPIAETWVYVEQDRLVGFLALIGNEVGAIFVQPERHRGGIGRQLMDHAAQLHDELEVEVFALNLNGRAFYTRYGFVPLEEKRHEPTGQQVLRLRFPGEAV
ncbi:MAG: GNAT family N-acetyltransferase [Blastopirellula sp. JB062]